MAEQKWGMGADMGPIEIEVINDSGKLADLVSSMTIDRTGDRIELVRLKLEAFDITIKDGWLHAKPKETA